MKRMIRFLCLLMIIFIPFVGSSPDAHAEGISANVTSSSDIMEQMEQFDKNGAFANHGVFRSLHVHMTSVNHFEQKEEVGKASKHLESFQVLLDNHAENQLVSEEAFETLSASAKTLKYIFDSLTIVQHGAAEAVVVVDNNADAYTRETAEILTEYVQKSTGAELPIRTLDELQEDTERFAGDTRIYIGFVQPDQADYMQAQLETMDRQGYWFHPHEKNGLTIIGPTPLGTRHGVYDFLERYVNVLWLMPGEAWEHVPQVSNLYVPKEEIREEPEFTYRSFNMGASGDQQRLERNVWQERNRMQSRASRQLEMSHNLYNLFPPEKYGETNPEFYPNGQPPEPGDRHGWQPCFSVEETVDVAITEIVNYFTENPDQNSFSLSANDGGRGYCEENPDHPHYPDKINSVGVVHMSDLYFDWVNKVVEGVLEVYPDKWFGVYAYQNTMDPPSFAVHPHVIIVITKDRMTWIDDDVRARGQQHLAAWNEVANQVGWYDYAYGVYYNLPRVYPHLAAENIRNSLEHNAVLHHQDMLNGLGDGPKAWILAKLKWDPQLDVDELLQTWYEAAVGTEAAQDLAEYFALWERFWTERVLGSFWFERSKHNTYLDFNNASYLNLVTDEDLDESKRLLQAVHDKAVTAEEKQRAQHLLQAFQFYEASVRSYPRKVNTIDEESKALDLLGNVMDAREERQFYAQERLDLVEQFKDDPALTFPLPPRGQWTEWNIDEFWRLAQYLRDREPEGGAVTEEVQRLAQREQPSKMREYARLLQIADPEHSLTSNFSFEEGAEDAVSWRKWIAESGTIERAEGIARTGNASMMLNLSDRGGPNQILEVSSGLTAAKAYFYTPPGTETSGSIRLTMSVRTADGQGLYSKSTDFMPLATTIGEWTALEILEDIPETIDGQKPGEIQFIINVEGLEQGTNVYIDDAVVYQDQSTINWDGMNHYEFWRVIDYMSEHEPDGGPMTDEVQMIADREEPSLQREYARLMLIAGLENSLTENASFEIGTGTDAPPWNKWVRDAGSINRVEGIARSGNASMEVDVIGNGGPHQTFGVSSGLTAMRLSYYTPIGAQTRGQIRLSASFRNAEGKALYSVHTDYSQLSDSAGKWNTIDVLEDVPEFVNGEKVARVQITAVVERLEEEVQVYIDDIVLYQDPQLTIHWDAIDAHEFWRVIDYMNEYEPQGGRVTDEVLAVAQGGEPSKSRAFAQLLLVANEGLEQTLSQNASFEEGIDGEAPPWRKWVRDAGSIQRVEGISYNGAASMEVDVTGNGGPYQRLNVSPGMTALRMHFYTPEGTNTNGQIRLSVSAKNEQGTTLRSVHTDYKQLAETVGKWASVDMLIEEIPEHVNGEPITQIQLGVVIERLEAETKVYVDDVVVFQ